MGLALRHHRYVLESNKSREAMFRPKNIRNDNIHAYNKRNSQFTDFSGIFPRTDANERGHYADSEDTFFLKIEDSPATDFLKIVLIIPLSLDARIT